ncbi:MAG: hypothetical protein Q7S02_06380 [bacterium]|nr:hypothetical protein [bacterium]
MAGTGQKLTTDMLLGALLGTHAIPEDDDHALDELSGERIEFLSGTTVLGSGVISEVKIDEGGLDVRVVGELDGSVVAQITCRDGQLVALDEAGSRLASGVGGLRITATAPQGRFAHPSAHAPGAMYDAKIEDDD